MHEVTSYFKSAWNYKLFQKCMKLQAVLKTHEVASYFENARSHRPSRCMKSQAISKMLEVTSYFESAWNRKLFWKCVESQAILKTRETISYFKNEWNHKLFWKCTKSWATSRARKVASCFENARSHKLLWKCTRPQAVSKARLSTWKAGPRNQVFPARQSALVVSYLTKIMGRAPLDRLKQQLLLTLAFCSQTRFFQCSLGEATQLCHSFTFLLLGQARAMMSMRLEALCWVCD